MTHRELHTTITRCARRACLLYYTIIILAISLIASSVSAHASSHTALVAAASSLRLLWPELIKAYQQDTGQTLPRVSFGSSGLLSTQIINGAPFDLFLSADSENINRLPSKRLVSEPEIFALGGLHLVSLSNKDFVKKLSIDALPELITEHPGKDTLRIAIPNPVHAPYGRAAKAALEYASVWPLPAQQLLMAENASQTLHFLNAGAADIAIVPMALLEHVQNDRLTSVAIPSDSYQLVEHIAVLLKPATSKDAAKNSSAEHLQQWLLGDAAKAVLENAGLQVP